MWSKLHSHSQEKKGTEVLVQNTVKQNKTITFWITCQTTLTVKLSFSVYLFYTNKQEQITATNGSELTLTLHQIIRLNCKILYI